MIIAAIESVCGTNVIQVYIYVWVVHKSAYIVYKRALAHKIVQCFEADF